LKIESYALIAVFDYDYRYAQSG